MLSGNSLNRVKAICFLLLPMLAFTLIGCAEYVYPSFSHQGRLLDNNGDPVTDGNYAIIYRLYHEATGGTAVYTENATIAVTDGFFNSDFGTANVDPKIFSEQTWLEITIDGETLTPRQLMRGAPYASGLVAGSAVIGSQPITYTYNSFDNLGSSFFAANTDLSEFGGSGITAITSAQIDNGPNSINRLDVAAVRGLAIDRDGDPDTGTYAGIFVSDDFNGVYAVGDYYAAYLSGHLYVTGNCNGCAMSMTAQNVGEMAIEMGDFVTAVGVELDPDYNTPIILVRQATTDDTVLGIATITLERGDYQTDTLAQLGYQPVDGSASTNNYLAVATEGLVQARLPETIKAGDFITFQAGNIVQTNEIKTSFAQVMGEPDEAGFTWLLLSR